MANKVYTELHFKGQALEIDRLVATVFTPESDFSFERVLPGVPDTERRERWGLEGDCCELLTHRANANRFDIRFKTNWTYPTGVINALCEAFPLLRVDGNISEELGNFECDIVNGTVVPLAETWRDRAEAALDCTQTHYAEQGRSGNDRSARSPEHERSSLTRRSLREALQNIIDYLHEEADDARRFPDEHSETHIHVSVIRLIVWLRRSRPRRLRSRKERQNLRLSDVHNDDKMKGGL